VAGLILHLIVGIDRAFSSYWLVNASQGIAFAAVGMLIASRHPRHLVAWLFLVIGLSHALAYAMGAYATAALEGFDHLPAVRTAVWIESWVWVPGVFGVATLLPLLFPDGSLPSRRFRPFMWTAVAGIFIFSLGLSLGAAPLDFPVEKLVEVGIAESLASLGSMLVTGTALAAVAGVVLRYRRSSGLGRLQLRWFVVAATLAILASMPWLPEDVSVAAQFVALPLVPIACGIAILKHRLYDLNVIVNRALVYMTSSVVLLSAYLAVVNLLGHVVGRGIASRLSATAVVAVLFAPVRQRMQRMINQLLYGQRDEPQALVSRLGHELIGLSSPAAALERVVTTISDALKLPYVGIELDVAGRRTLLTEAGDQVTPTERVLLIYGGDEIGALIVGPRAGERSLSEHDRAVLDELAHHIAVAAYGARVTAQLQRSRRDLVAVQAEERRRIRRELHDELGPQLAGVNLQSEAALQMIESDPSSAVRLLEKVGAEARKAVDDIRTIAYGLRPPALDELGLMGAIEERASRLADGSGVTFEVSALSEAPPLPAAVEVAAYRITLEALANAMRHARASRCVVHLEFNHELRLEVNDDGVGLPEDFHPGVGIASMQERAEELGGNLSITLHPQGGTLVRASIPIDRSFEG
jgi:signal transduction histidine kinase